MMQHENHNYLICEAINSINIYTVKKYFQDLLSQHIFFCHINFIIIYLVEITYYFEFLMNKSISFIVLTHFFQFNQIKILRQPATYFLKLNQQYFFTASNHNIFSFVKPT